MRVVIVGGSGHIGSWLTPRVVEAGHTTICVSRSQRQPYFLTRLGTRSNSLPLIVKLRRPTGVFAPEFSHCVPMLSSI